MRVAVVSPYPVPPATNGARVRIKRLTSWIREHGHDIHFVWAPTEDFRADGPDIESALADVWGQATVLPLKEHPVGPPGAGDWGIDDWVADYQEEPFRAAMEGFDPDVVLVNYIFLSRFLDWSPRGALRYLDTHDRLSRRKIYEEAGVTAGFFYTTAAEELEACRRADVVFAIQDNEVTHFAASGRPVAVVGHPEPGDYRSRAVRSSRVRAGTIAAHNKFNEIALDELLEVLEHTEVLSRRGATLTIAGTMVSFGTLSGKYEQLPEGVETLGYVADVDAFYDDLDLVVNPTTLGTGLKIKTMEALAKGIPLLSTSVGTDGIAVRSPFHDCADVPELVRRLDQLLVEPQRLSGLANLSRHIHAEYQLALEQNLGTLFDSAVLTAHRDDNLAEYVASGTGRLNSLGDNAGVTLDDPLLGARRQLTMAHVVNPVPTRYESDLYAAQPVTFESMRRAAAYADTRGLDVDLISVVAEGDQLRSPAGFSEAQRRACVVSSIKQFQRPRPLPLLSDILEIAAEESDAEWLIYTNADIAVLPHFYAFIAEKIHQGHDAIVINRRTIPRNEMDISKLETLYSKIGEKHPGYDCFVFRRQLIDQFALGDVCVGVHLVGKVLLWNLMAHATRPILVDEDHLTFHLGDDNAGKTPEFIDYIEHNSAQAVRTMARIDGFTTTRKRFNRSLAVFPSNALMLRFSPTIISDEDGALYPQFADRPIFVHALFRTGSTFLWNALRSSHQHLAFYEPLHEELANFNLERLDHYRAKHTPTTRHRFDGKWLFAEYEALLQPGRVGVPGYRKSMAYETFADNSAQPVLRSYIDGLITAADVRQPLLQLNRSALRQRWFHNEYPDAHHLYLVREPREQWASYLSFMVGNARGFARNDAIICGMNRHRALIEPLNSLVELVRHPSEGNFFATYDEVFDQYSWEERYTLFYYLWLQGLLEAAATGSHIVDMNSIADNRSERMRLETYLGVRGAQANLAGLIMTSYEDRLPLAEDGLETIERRVKKLIHSEFGANRFRRLEEINPRIARSLNIVLDLASA